jgi:hypothetical protein
MSPVLVCSLNKTDIGLPTTQWAHSLPPPQCQTLDQTTEAKEACYGGYWNSRPPDLNFPSPISKFSSRHLQEVSIIIIFMDKESKTLEGNSLVQGSSVGTGLIRTELGLPESI